ncbi:hypothetical protein E2C01_086574 [Portunus trituberculatus]|uniref:Uncharacterized protein n=1 Tax=Portunus trituberculatus TaxID=210409 RepID=A0A5B7J170_PORTR|nr:hypothetical protein [Portunus trituberculatus]
MCVDIGPVMLFVTLCSSLQVVRGHYKGQQCCVVKLKMDKDRKKIIERRAAGRAARQGKDKEKFTAMDTSA